MEGTELEGQGESAVDELYRLVAGSRTWGIRDQWLALCQQFYEVRFLEGLLQQRWSLAPRDDRIGIIHYITLCAICGISVSIMSK
jgi:hypothetical protein